MTRPNRYNAARDPSAARQRVRPLPRVRPMRPAPSWSLPVARVARWIAAAVAVALVVEFFV